MADYSGQGIVITLSTGISNSTLRLIKSVIGYQKDCQTYSAVWAGC